MVDTDAREPTASGRVSPEQAGDTVAAVVRALMDGLPWSKARALVSSGRVLCDGEPLRDPARRLRAGQRIEVHQHAPKRRETAVELLHVDPDVVVVEKPAGLVTVPYEADDRDTLLHRAHASLRRYEGGRHLPPLRVVSRLDKDTSGVILFARTRAAERGLGEQFRRHSVERCYLALVYGRAESTTHDTMLVPNRGDRRRGSWRGRQKPPKSARRAVTHVECREHFTAKALPWTSGGAPGISLVECRLQTGRQHQIRIHLGERSNPLVGERVYDRDYDGPRLVEFAEGRGRPLLHAQTLGFVHPTRDRELRFEVQPPEDFAAVLARLRGE